MQNYGIRVFDLGQAKDTNDKEEGRDVSQGRNQENEPAPGEQEVTPIIFEECYVKSDDFRFVQQVKRSFEVTEAKITAKNEIEGFDRVNDYIGVHLFVL